MPAAVSRWGLQQAYFGCYGVDNRFGHPYPQTLATAKDGLAERTASARKAAEDYRPIPQATKTGIESRAAFIWFPLRNMEYCKVEYISGVSNRYKGLQRLAAAVGAGRRVCLPSAGIYIKRQAGREGVPQGAEGLKSAQKGALVPDAEYELWYQDESEFHLHPHLTRAWMRKGEQMRVRSAGINRKQTVFGVFRYGRGLFYYHIQPRKNSWGLRALLYRLAERARRKGRRIVLVMDQGNPHHAKVVHKYLDKVGKQLEVFWLPHYCPQLNLIERLWKHLKCSRMANYLFDSFSSFELHLGRSLADFAVHTDFVLSLTASNATSVVRKKLVGIT